jgi:hypothetical protein
MLIPSKFSGYSFDGIRRCFGPGGGGGSGGDPASIGDPASTGTGGDPASIGDPGSGPGVPGGDGTNYVYTPTYANTTNTGVNTNRGAITGMNFTGTGNTAGTSNIRDNSSFKSMGGMRYDQAGGLYNSLLQQGFTGNDIRGALTTQGKPVSDSDYGFLVQNAAMTSPTGRPMAGSDQFFQPVYNTSYQNYARPATQFDTSAYGTQASRSPASTTMSRDAINQNLTNFYNTNYRDNPNGLGMGDTLDFMREKGINRDDFQTWGGVKNYGPQMSVPSAQTQRQPFNPYFNSFDDTVQSPLGRFGGLNGVSAGYGGYMPQMQSPFSYQPSYQQQYSPYQMQSPFSYQQPTPQRTSSGPSQAIVGRSSQMRGTPNVMRRAEGGIASLVDDVE